MVGSGHAARVSSMRISYKILVRKPGGVSVVRIPSIRKDNIKMEYVDLFSSRRHWRYSLKTVPNLWSPKSWRYFLTCLNPVISWTSTLMYGFGPLLQFLGTYERIHSGSCDIGRPGHVEFGIISKRYCFRVFCAALHNAYGLQLKTQ